jgi:hypothetical protein
MEIVGVLIEKYEDEIVPELNFVIGRHARGSGVVRLPLMEGPS